MNNNVNRYCGEIGVVDFTPRPPKDVVSNNDKIYWLHFRVISEEDSLYNYTFCSLDIGLNKWACHSIHIGCFKQSMC